MNRVLSDTLKIITPDDGCNYFFAYYDLQPYSRDGRNHLAHRVGFADRLPVKEDTAGLGCIDPDGHYTEFAKTQAWNFQQGAQLQWDPRNPSEEVIYNERGGEHDYRTVIHHIASGKKRTTDRAAANVSPCGKWGLGINFSRVYGFRPGYGYAGVPDRFADENQPENDGVFLIDMESGVSRLIIDYFRIAKEFPNSDIGGDKLTVNHITFSPSSERFVFLVRNSNPSKRNWSTLLLTSDREGNMRRLLDYTMVSHYNWRDDSHLLAYCRVGGTDGLWLLDDAPDVSAKKSTAVRLVSPCFRADLHCIYSPDRRFIIGDSYPDREGYRPLYQYDTETETEKLLLRSFSPNPPVIDIRCDLHARWSRDGRTITFDGFYEGKRCIYELTI